MSTFTQMSISSSVRITEPFSSCLTFTWDKCNCAVRFIHATLLLQRAQGTVFLNTQDRIQEYKNSEQNTRTEFLNAQLSKSSSECHELLSVIKKKNPTIMTIFLLFLKNNWRSSPPSQYSKYFILFPPCVYGFWWGVCCNSLFLLGKVPCIHTQLSSGFSFCPWFPAVWKWNANMYIFRYFSSLVTPELPGPVVWCLTLIWGNS